ncbi:MAG: ABC transporter substrate-binding protein [Betaproteobacteria bacterium]
MAAGAAILAVIGVARWRHGAPATADGPHAGGDLVVSVRTEPRTYNRFASRDFVTDLVTLLTQAKLVRINRVTQEVEPWLAERWTRSADGLQYTLSLRRNVVFSDGQPFTAADVLFSFEAAYDTRNNSPLADALEVGGRPLEVAAPDAHTVVVTFPSAFAPGVRILDNLPILPRHVLQAAEQAGTFASAWGIGTTPADVVGLGPFVLSEYVRGQRLVFTRNPHYWRTDDRGTRLPYLDRVVLEVVPDQNAEVLRLEAGQIDATGDAVRPEDYAPLNRAADAGRITLRDVGVALNPDVMWFNLKPGAFAGDPRASWLQRDELRQAISLAVDRQAYADTVFLGAGVPVFGPITPANRKWFDPDLPRPGYDPAKARTLLASIGLVDRNGDGLLEDPANEPARFTLVVYGGRTSLTRGAAVLRDDLARIGLGVDIVTLDQAAVIQRILSGKYEAVAFNVQMTDTDPANNLDFFLSSGSAHLWNIGQAHPATDWERRIDELMAQQVAAGDAVERRRLFDEVQGILAEHQPALYFVAPRVYVATSRRVSHVEPAVTPPQILWAPDTIAVAGGSPPTH